MSGRQQSGIQRRSVLGGMASSGLLLRGVVVNTYVLDDPNHPAAAPEGTEPELAEPVSVYCDVLTYSTRRAFHTFPLTKVPVLQDRGGLHDGRIWMPKAARIDITGNPADINAGTILGNLDGDHVLVGFMDDNLNQPIILGGIPHPSHDVGNLDRLKGHRRGLKLADGHPDFWKHHGTFFGVDDNGDLLHDTTHANDGQLNPDGTEPDPPTDGKGAQKASLPMDAEKRDEWFDMADPMAPVSKAFESVKKDLREVSLEDGKTTEKMDLTSYELSLDQAKAILKLVMANLELKLDSGATLKVEGKDATAKLTLGDGAKSAMIAEAFQTWWDSTLKPLFTAFDAHVHPTGVGPSGPPAPVVALPSYLSTITSTKVKFPDA